MAQVHLITSMGQACKLFNLHNEGETEQPLQLETLDIYHKDKRFLTKTVKFDSENNLILKKDLLPTLKEVYQSFQLQTFKVYKQRLKRQVLAKIHRTADLVVLVIPSGRCTSFCATEHHEPERTGSLKIRKV